MSRSECCTGDPEHLNATHAALEEALQAGKQLPIRLRCQMVWDVLQQRSCGPGYTLKIMVRRLACDAGLADKA